MLHFSKMGFPAEWDPSSCAQATMWLFVPKWVYRGRYNTILSLPKIGKNNVSQLFNGSTGKLRFAHRSSFQATIQLLIEINRDFEVNL